MPIIKRIRKYSLIVAAVLLLFTGAVFFLWRYLPYQNQVATQISAQLAAKGFFVKSLNVVQASGERAEIADVVLGKTHPLSIRSINAEYSWQDLSNGYVRALAINGLNATFYKNDGGWTIGGLEPLFTSNAKPSANWPEIGFDETSLSKLLPEKMQVQGSVTVSDATLPITLPFTLNASPNALQLKTDNVTAKFGKIAATLSALKADAALQEGEWKGNAKANVAISDAPLALPALAANVNYTITAKGAKAKLVLNDATTAHTLQADVLISPLGMAQSQLQNVRARIPYASGALQVETPRMSLSGTAPITADLVLENVDLAALLEQISGGKVKGTGLITGRIPFTYSPKDGRIIFAQGGAEAAGKGQLSVAPETLAAGDSEQMAQVRAALQNFHYDTLTLRVESDAESKPVITLKLEGKSPEAFEDRPVKLTVNLRGDTLPLFKQSVFGFSNPGAILKEKP